ncbi:MAG: hypothetical protein RLZZ241_699 [Bacteroidota bacterium]|jgi:hypothetical protein
MRLSFKAGFFVLCILTGYGINAQKTLERGYIIDDSGMRIEGWISDEKWGDNPEDVVFRTSRDAASNFLNVKNISAFGIGDYLKYERHKVRLEISSDLTSDLDYRRSPNYEERLVFLKLLVNGPVKLLQFKSSVSSRFFYQLSDSEEIIPLVYKRYRMESGAIGANLQFRNQLEVVLKCSNGIPLNTDRLEYKQSALIQHFEKYAACSGSHVQTQSLPVKDTQVKIQGRLGLQRTGLILDQNVSYELPSVNQVTADYGASNFPVFGVQVEVRLPSRGENWALFVEPSYYKTNFNTQYTRSYPALEVLVKTEAKIGTFELPIGIKRYIYVGNNNSFFLNMAVAMQFNMASNFVFISDSQLGRPDNIEAKAPQGNFAFGVGYQANKRLSFEIRMHTTRNILNDNPDWNAIFGPGGSLIFGISL